MKSGNGDFILGWLTRSAQAGAPDTVLFQKLDDDGERLWDEDLVAASSMEPEPYGISYVSSFSFIENNGDFAVLLRVGYGFGFDGNRYTFFNGDGEMTGAVNGWPIGPQSYFGGSGILPTFDGSGDVLVYYSTGNGAGAALQCARGTAAGTIAWGPVDITQGTSGLQYTFSGIADEYGATFVWQGNGDGTPINLYSRRLSFSGNLAWGGNTTNICIADGTQDYFSWRRSGADYYIFWGDGRPGVNPGYYDIYAQKFDTTGALEWAQNGIGITSFNTYMPYPRFSIDAEGNLIVCHQSTVQGYVAQKVTPEGQLPWGPDAMTISTITFNPTYTDHFVVSSGDNTIAAWSSGDGSTDNVYITRIDEVLHAALPEADIPYITIFPNPANDRVDISLPSGINEAEISLVSSTGKTVEKAWMTGNSSKNTVSFSISGLPAGLYLVSVVNGGKEMREKLLISR